MDKADLNSNMPPLTPISINDPIFEEIIDSPPAPMMLASAAAVLYDYLEPESQIKNEQSEDDAYSSKFGELQTIFFFWNILA